MKTNVPNKLGYYNHGLINTLKCRNHVDVSALKLNVLQTCALINNLEQNKTSIHGIQLAHYNCATSLFISTCIKTTTTTATMMMILKSSK